MICSNATVCRRQKIRVGRQLKRQLVEWSDGSPPEWKKRNDVSDFAIKAFYEEKEKRKLKAKQEAQQRRDRRKRDLNDTKMV